MGNVYLTQPGESGAMRFNFHCGYWEFCEQIELGEIGKGAAAYAGRWCVVHATDRDVRVCREDVQAMMVGAVSAVISLCNSLYHGTDDFGRYAAAIPPYMVDKLSSPRCNASLEMQSVLAITDGERLVELLAEFISKTATLPDDAVRAFYCRTMLEEEPRRMGVGIHRYDILELVNINVWPLCPAAAKYSVEERRWNVVKQMGPKPEYRVKAGNWCAVTASSETIQVSSYLLADMLSGLLPAYYELCDHCATYVEYGGLYLNALPSEFIEEQSVLRVARTDIGGEVAVMVNGEIYRYNTGNKSWSGAQGVLCGKVEPVDDGTELLHLTGLELCELVASFIECFASMQPSNVRVIYGYNMLEGNM